MARKRNRKHGESLPKKKKKIRSLGREELIICPPSSKKKYKAVQLKNGLRALLSDPDVTVAAVSMSIRVGYFLDPPEAQGLCHLLAATVTSGSETSNALNPFFTLISILLTPFSVTHLISLFLRKSFSTTHFNQISINGGRKTCSLTGHSQRRIELHYLGSRTAKALLGGRGLWGVIDPSEAIEEDKKKSKAVKQREDQAVLATLQGALDISVLEAYSYCTSAKALWDTLQEVFVVLKDLKYAVKMDGDKATFGITDHAQDHLGDVVFVELPDVGDSVSQGKSFGAVESVKASSDINSPVSGKVVEVNNELTESPGLVNSSPYEQGWMIKVEVSDAGETEKLMDSDKYSKFCEEEDAKH